MATSLYQYMVRPSLGMLGLLLIFSGCALPFWSSQTIEVVVPDVPEAWNSLPGIIFEISYRDELGTRRTEFVKPGALTVLQLERGGFQAILARPFFLGKALRPAGELYPSGLTSVPLALLGQDRLELSWWGGWLGEVATALEDAGRDPRRFALDRLRRESEALLLDPWLLDPRETAHKMAVGGFRLRLPGGADAPQPVSLPGDAAWASENPLARPVLLDSPGCGFELRPGVHRFYRAGEELTLSLSEKGEILVMRRDLPESLARNGEAGL